MANHRMNYPMYNTFPYPQIVQQPSFYGQQPSARHLQPPIAPYTGYQMYSPTPTPAPTQPQYNNSYDHLIQSAAETLAAFTAPPEQITISTYPPPQPQKNHRYTPNSTAPPKPSVRTYYCETCRIECGGHNSYQAHINGSKHLKKVSNNQNQQKNASVFRCELCDITCTSSDAHQAHLDGSKHQKTIKLHLKLGKTIPKSTHPAVMSANESQATGTKEVKQSSENSAKMVGIEYVETIYDNTRTIKSYFCKLCDCTFNDANARDTHLKGKRHRLSYKRKVDPTLQVDSNRMKPPSPKQHPIDPPNNGHQRPLNLQNQQTEIDDDTRCLMMLHERIIPPQNLLGTIEQFVSTVETALKSCSDQLSSSQESVTADTPETVVNKSPLLGISRIGALAKNLLIRNDRVFQVAVVCAEWPTMDLVQQVFSLLTEMWSHRDDPQCHRDAEIINVYTETAEGRMCVSISLTSLSTQPGHVQIAREILPASSCLSALYAMHSVQWFQKQVSTRQHAPALIRCLRYKTKISRRWQSLSSEAIEILIDNTLGKFPSPVAAVRRILEYLAGGLLLPNSPALRLPWQTDSVNEVFDQLTAQDRNDITQEAQIGLRLMAFGQLNSWFEQRGMLFPSPTPLQKRSFRDDDNQILAKRQCLNSEGSQEH